MEALPKDRLDQERNDAELMQKVQAGDEEAFRALVDRYRDPLVAYLTRLSGSTDEGEDLAQEAFVRLYETASRYRESGRFAPFLYRIATNLLRTRERRRQRWRLLRPLLPRSTDAPPRGEQAVLEAETRRKVRRALAGLPLPFRVPLLLHEVEDWSCAEIAELLGCAEGTIKSRLHRGRRRLRDALNNGTGDTR